MNDFPLYLASFLLMLGVLIVVHELGHFLVARWCGVKVLRFSVGFGRPLWRRRFGQDGTEWVVGAFPLGGYVKMLDEREGEVAPEELDRTFNRQPVGRRSAIVAAGPAANFLFAVVLLWGLFLYGNEEMLPVLGKPAAGTAAARAGIANGEQVQRLDGEPVATWDEFRWRLLQKAGEEPEVGLQTIDGRGNIAIRRLSLASVAGQKLEGDFLERLGLAFYRPEIPAVLDKIMAGGAGQRAGLAAGDEIVAVDGVAIDFWPDVVLAVRQSPGRELLFRVRRQGGILDLPVTPGAVAERGRTIGQIGVSVADKHVSGRTLKTFVRYGALDAGRKALRETWEKSAFSLAMFGKMLTGEVSWRNLSGPVTIADYAGQSAKLGADYYLRFMALVSISLGVLNLLPIPVLDGGYLMYHMIEVVKRGPLSERAMEIGQQVGLSILFALMAFAFFNDINRLLSG